MRFEDSAALGKWEREEGSHQAGTSWTIRPHRPSMFKAKDVPLCRCCYAPLEGKYRNAQYCSRSHRYLHGRLAARQ